MVTAAVVRVDEVFQVTDAARSRMSSVLNLVEQLLRLEGVLPEHQKRVLAEALWKWTEAPGMPPHPKYNIRFCSEGVVRAVRGSNEVPINHEHVHTRQAMIAALLDGRVWAREELEQFFAENGAACIVTVEEHALLGPSKRSGWDRYDDVGIRIYDKSVGGFVSRPGVPTSSPPDAEPSAPMSGAEEVDRAVDQHAREQFRPPLKALARLARTEGGVTALQQSKSGKPSYFRVHDAQIGEPTRAVAYGNFRGNVDFALQADDLPHSFAVHESVVVRPSNRHPYRVRCELTCAGGPEVAQSLLVLALEKLRADHS